MIDISGYVCNLPYNLPFSDAVTELIYICRYSAKIEVDVVAYSARVSIKNTEDIPQRA